MAMGLSSPRPISKLQLVVALGTVMAIAGISIDGLTIVPLVNASGRLGRYIDSQSNSCHISGYATCCSATADTRLLCQQQLGLNYQACSHCHEVDHSVQRWAFHCPSDERSRMTVYTLGNFCCTSTHNQAIDLMHMIEVAIGLTATIVGTDVVAGLLHTYGVKFSDDTPGFVVYFSLVMLVIKSAVISMLVGYNFEWHHWGVYAARDIPDCYTQPFQSYYKESVNEVLLTFWYIFLNAGLTGLQLAFTLYECITHWNHVQKEAQIKQRRDAYFRSDVPPDSYSEGARLLSIDHESVHRR